ncbi:MAG: phosphatidate cytidylyltransferase [Bacteroidota bacterium]|nr:phosphatidate cytidylyltransferase [Bacteroidota bacterium]
MRTSDIWSKSLVQRVVVAAIGIPVVVGAVWAGGVVLTLLVSLAAAVAVWEYGELMWRREVYPQKLLLVGGTAAQVWGTFVVGHALEALGGVALTVVLLAWAVELRKRRGTALLNTAATVGGVCYVGGLLSTLVQVRQAELQGLGAVTELMLLALLGSIWIGDSAAYAIGSRWGRLPLAPQISPRKTWEGAAACLLATAAAFWGFLQWWLPNFPGIEALFVGILIGIVGQVGDLAESRLKRDVGVKDSSALLPGHGGMLDRIDSVLFAAPGLYLWLLFRGWIPI